MTIPKRLYKAMGSLTVNHEWGEVIEELQRLSDEKLKQLALQRHKGGRRKSTTTALRAQLVLWRRAGKPFQSEAHWVRNHSETGVHF